MNIGVFLSFSECLSMIADDERDDSACCIVGSIHLISRVKWDGKHLWIDCCVDFCQNDDAQVALGTTALVRGHSGGVGFYEVSNI